MSYQVEFLDHAAFDALPYPNMDTSLGVADPKTKKAFVRKTGVPVVDLFNAAHELEHLEDGPAGAHSDHFRNGVYYKDFGQTLQTIGPALSLIPGVGPIASAGAELGGGYMHNQSVQKQQKSMMDQQQNQGNVMGQFQNAAQGNTPNVVQADGGGGGGSAGGGPSGGNGLGGIQDQIYGRQAGR